MNFLAAKKALAGFAGGPLLDFTLAMSGTSEQLVFYARAQAAARGYEARIDTLPFGTLQQFLRGQADTGETVAALLFPWDFAALCDWRSGLPDSPPPIEEVLAEAERAAAQIARRCRFCFYVPAVLPPLWPSPKDAELLAAGLEMTARRIGAEIVPADQFSMGAYLASGTPVAGQHLGAVAGRIVTALTAAPAMPRKVLISDLDNVMWHGVVGEDGPEGVAYGPEGPGFRHFIYQSFLRKLKAEGVLLAAVTRNDRRDAEAPFTDGRMLLKRDDLVAVMASYNAKSAQIREIAAQLSLGLDSFVFVDDNPIELAEVSAALPEVACVAFPSADDGLAPLLAELQAHFARTGVTEEDRQRTELYRRRLESMAPSELAGGDVTDFLRSLDMELRLHNRSKGERSRAVQLINKTNQFNLNGRRWQDEEVDRLLAEGGVLWTATLADRTGSHGEILACLIGPEGQVESLVMSCRVLERKVEHAFLAWLTDRMDGAPRLRYAPTERNEPLRKFLAGTLPADLPADPALLALEGAAFAESLSLFRITAE